jgi:hypothetical protein
MPDGINISIDMAEARRVINDLPKALERALRGAMNDASALLLREVKIYGPERAGQTYKRTHTLERSWSRTPITGHGTDLHQTIGSNANMAPYNRRVQDRDNQAAAFRSRWREHTAQAVAERNEQHVQDMFQARVRSEINSL